MQASKCCDLTTSYKKTILEVLTPVSIWNRAGNLWGYCLWLNIWQHKYWDFSNELHSVAIQKIWQETRKGGPLNWFNTDSSKKYTAPIEPAQMSQQNGQPETIQWWLNNQHLKMSSTSDQVQDHRSIMHAWKHRVQLALWSSVVPREMSKFLCIPLQFDILLLTLAIHFSLAIITSLPDALFVTYWHSNPSSKYQNSE